jgi:hypothetical protein
LLSRPSPEELLSPEEAFGNREQDGAMKKADWEYGDSFS